jgi:hypothetical protein
MALVQLAGPSIAAGQSLSAALDCTAGRIVRIYTPAAWTGSNITFQLSFDGVTWADLVDRGGKEVSAAVKPNSVIILSDYAQQIAWIKIRSGTAAAPLVQAAQRDFKTTIEK